MGNEQSTNNEPTQNGKIPEKHENGSVNGLSATITSSTLETDVQSNITVHQNGEPQSSKPTTETTDSVTVEPDAQPVIAQDVSELLDVASEILDVASEITETIPNKEQAKKGKEPKRHIFGKLFKKKSDRAADEEKAKEKENQSSNEDQVDVSQTPPNPEQETANVKEELESVLEPKSEDTPESSPEEEVVPETENGNAQPAESQEESNPEENLVMNFFKTFVTTTKTSKKETAAPDATKDQVAQISELPAVPKGMPAPPPPPPEPPKLEPKGDSTKPAKPATKEEPKAAAKDPEASKGKSAKDTLNKFFRPKDLLVFKKPRSKSAPSSGANAKPSAVTIKESPQPAIEVEIQPGVEVKETSVEVPEPVVEVQVELQEAAAEVAQQILEVEKVDPSKTGTLEAAAKPEPPPPVQEEKKGASKSSFLSRFKSKVLLEHMTTKVQAASTSGVRLLRKTAGLAAEPKKTTSAPAAAAEAAQAVKAKEEPKYAAKSSEAAVDNKPVSAAYQAGDDAASAPKKLEKRNSIHLFFKALGQKRHSTDAGVQTEPGTAASEKTK
ncbi:breast carcinoma-amplified sequence 1 isoform X2 [Kryptolebias marmoratus]|uniref:breast carcinoma-amplified sequence 1 isoform X2 n=1 Tax=Kryptolebias marmoratus TaxID=37003 RepID=UPI0007F91839|nr:breast carcinoma-amplified sequence 1 isoform X2 [Kryptolebias marmoratus]